MKGLTDALTDLGNTPEQIAATLKSLGIKGQKSMECDCPLVRYLRRVTDHDFLEVWADEIKFRGRDNRLKSFPLPEPHANFVFEFDAGKYPELEEPPCAAPSPSPA